MNQDTRLRIAVFIDFDNIEIGVKNTLGASFDAGLVLEALKERGEVVAKTAYSDWQRSAVHSRQLTQHAIKMVQRNVTPGGDKNGADINLALDALEMAFTLPHINAFVIVGGDSDFISLVEKLKQYDKKVFVVGGRQFTSAIMQKNCHEFIAYENLIGSKRPAGRGAPSVERTPIEQAIPLVTRALKVMSEREVSPQMSLLKSTLLQLDSTFSERSYGAGSFRDFSEKLARINVITLHHGKNGLLVELADGTVRPVAASDSAAESDGAVAEAGGEPREHATVTRPAAQDARDSRGPAPAPALVGDATDGLREFKAILASAKVPRWPMYLRNVKQVVRQTSPNFNERAYGFASLVDLLRAAQKDNFVRVERDRQGVLRIFQGSAFVSTAAQDASLPVAPISGSTSHEYRDDDDSRGNRAAPQMEDEPDPPQPDLLTAAEITADPPQPGAAKKSRGRRSRPATSRPHAAAASGTRNARPRRPKKTT